METRVKLSILADAAKYDASCASSGAKRSNPNKGLGNSDGTGICHSYTPDGRCVSLLKILLTNYCIYDCQFCINRVTSDTPRARFTVDEVVTLTVEFYKRNYIEGLFLSSGIITSPDYTMEQLVAVARTLRTAHAFNGYIHLKTIPGAAPDLIALAGQYADRLSANIELPTQTDLAKLAPEKKPEHIGHAMHVMRDRITEAKEERAKTRLAPRFAPAGQSTQMIVGATPTPDAAIIRTASNLYARYNLRRIYYSAFSPIPDGDNRLPIKPPPLVREHRLYQADWLMRYYGFAASELLAPNQSHLDLDKDPKLAWALRDRGFFPVDVNRAPRERLLRVPGLGTRNVDRILQVRRHHKLTLADLQKLRLPMHRLRPFVIAADHNPDALRLDRTDLEQRVTRRDPQLNLFEAATTGLTGQL